MDVLTRTASDHPDESSLDDGAQVLTYESRCGAPDRATRG